MTTFWVVWDGAAEWIVAQLVELNCLPATAELRRRGLSASLTPSSPNCQTPPGLASLFTGSTPAENGVTGFWVPGARSGDVSTSKPAFAPGICSRPMLWDDFDDPTTTSMLLHTPWTFDENDRVSDHVVGAVEACGRRIARERACVVAPGTSVVWDDIGVAVTIVHPTPGGDTLELFSEGTAPVTLSDEWTLYPPGDGPRAWYRIVKTENGLACVRTGVWQPRIAGSDPESRARLRRATSELPFVGNSFWHTVAAALDCEELPDLVVLYLPLTDDIGHELVGLLDSVPAPNERSLASLGWDLLGRGYAVADEILGDVMIRARPEGTIVLSADHGMVPVTATFYPNNVLVDGGFAISEPDGDDGAAPRQSPVFYHAANNGLLVRGSAGPTEHVPASPDPLLEAMRLLLECRDPATGVRAIQRFVDERGAELERTAPPADSAYAIFASGILPRSTVTSGHPAFGAPLRSAAHTTYNGDPRLDATFTVCGPDALPERGDALTIHRNEQVSGVVRASVEKSTRRRRPRRPAGQIRLSVIGPSGAGKSTFFEVATDVCAKRNIRVTRHKLASPLYRLQQAVRAEVIINDDLRDHEVDYPELAGRAFRASGSRQTKIFGSPDSTSGGMPQPPTHPRPVWDSFLPHSPFTTTAHSTSTVAGFAHYWRHSLILSGHEIAREVGLGRIKIDDFDPERMEPNSYGFRLGDAILEYTSDVLDPERVPQTVRTEIGEEGIILQPGKCR